MTTGLATRQRLMMDRRIRTAGAGVTVDLRRPHGLDTVGKTLTLTVSGAHAEDATTLAITGTGFRGEAPAGLKLSVEGTEYTVQAEAEVVDDVLTVTIAPALAGALAGGEAVTVTRPYGSATYVVSRQDFRQEDVDEFVRADQRRLSLVDDGSVRAPEIGDEVDSTSERVVAVSRLGTVEGEVAGWEVTVGGIAPRGRRGGAS